MWHYRLTIFNMAAVRHLGFVTVSSYDMQ